MEVEGGATKIEFDDAKAALSELEADDRVVVQAKAPADANSSTTSGFAARVPGAKTPPAPYHDADGAGIGAGATHMPRPLPLFIQPRRRGVLRTSDVGVTRSPAKGRGLAIAREG